MPIGTQCTAGLASVEAKDPGCLSTMSTNLHCSLTVVNVLIEDRDGVSRCSALPPSSFKSEGTSWMNYVGGPHEL